MATWIDFKELRSQLRFLDVLHHYKVELKIKGDQASGFCPLPGHHSKREGKRRSPSFSVHLTKGIFQCFSCGTEGRGNVIDFAVLMDGLNPKDPQHVRQTALKLQQTFLSAASSIERVKPIPPGKKPPPAQQPDGEIVVNAPLDFELKHLDPEHPYLSSRGFGPETIEHFGLGFCAKGMMKDRIAIPLHDPSGQLIGYAGRLVDDEQISEENPKYRLPGSRQRDGVRFEFHKSEFLYNGNRIHQPVEDLIVVEGFPSVWWLWQCGHEDVVALMGSSCSPEQGKLIVDLVVPNGRIWLMPDSDEAALRCAKSVLEQVSPHRFIRWIPLDGGRQPTDYTNDELKILLQLLGAGKSGRSENLSVAQPTSKSNGKAGNRWPPRR